MTWSSKHSLKGDEEIKRDIGSSMEIARGLVILSTTECTSILEAKNWLQTSSFQKILFHNQSSIFMIEKDILLNNSTNLKQNFSTKKKDFFKKKTTTTIKTATTTTIV